MESPTRSPGFVRQSVESVAARTDRWWYLPALCGVSAVCLTALFYGTNAPVWALETLVVLIQIPATILSVPAIAFDICNKCGDGPPPGLFIYPPALVIALFLGTWAIAAVTGVYLAVWVWRDGRDDQ